MLKKLSHSIENGELVLFLGAGCSTSSLDKSGFSLPGGGQLAKDIATFAGLPYANEALPEVYAASVHEIGTVKLNGFLGAKFSGCTPSQEYQVLARFPWRRIYTTNIDDALDTALQKHSPQHLVTKYRSDPIQDATLFYDDVHLVKLNGCAKRPHDGFIFSPQEYAQGATTLPPWYQELATDFFRYKFLFIGSRLNEPLFYHAVERYRSLATQKNIAALQEPRAYLILPSATAIQVRSLAAANIEFIQGSLETFANSLKTYFVKLPTPNEIAERRYPEIRQVLAKGRDEAQKDLLSLLNHVTPVTRALLAKQRPRSVGRIYDFYRGFKPTWRDIVDEVPAELAALTRFMEHVERNIKEGHRLTVLVGPAGSGKTTMLMQAAVRLSEKFKQPVFFIRDLPLEIKPILGFLDRSYESGYFLLTDNLNVFSDDLDMALSEKYFRNGFIVASERQNIWERRVTRKVSKYAANIFKLERIEKSDVPKLLEKLERFGPWTRLQKMRPAQRESEVFEKSRRQLLIGLLEATSGVGFERIIQDDLSRIDDKDARILLLIVAMGTVNRVHMPKSIAIRALLNFNPKGDVGTLLASLSGIVQPYNDSFDARHPVYVRHLIEGMLVTDEIKIALVALVEAFTAYKAPIVKYLSKMESKIFKSVLNHRFLSQILRRKDVDVIDVYARFEKSLHADGLYWLQYGLALRSFGRQNEALEKLRYAVQAFAGHHTLHALSHQQMIMALNSQERSAAMQSLDEAIGGLRDLRRVIPDEDTYPIITLAEGHTAIVRKFDGDDAARRVSSRYVNEINELKKQYPSDQRLEQCWMNMLKYATTGDYQIMFGRGTELDEENEDNV